MNSKLVIGILFLEMALWVAAEQEEKKKQETQEIQSSHFQMDDKSPEITVTATEKGVQVKAKPARLRITSKPNDDKNQGNNNSNNKNNNNNKNDELNRIAQDPSLLKKLPHLSVVAPLREHFIEPIKYNIDKSKKRLFFLNPNDAVLLDDDDTKPKSKPKAFRYHHVLIRSRNRDSKFSDLMNLNSDDDQIETPTWKVFNDDEEDTKFKKVFYHNKLRLKDFPGHIIDEGNHKVLRIAGTKTRFISPYLYEAAAALPCKGSNCNGKVVDDDNDDDDDDFDHVK